jgi:hypothetical protein
VLTEAIAAADYSLVPARHVGINVDRSDAESTRQRLATTLDSITLNLHEMDQLADSVRKSVLNAQ